MKTVIKFEHSVVADYEDFVRWYKNYPKTSLEVESLGQSFIILADRNGKVKSLKLRKNGTNAILSFSEHFLMHYCFHILVKNESFDE